MDAKRTRLLKLDAEPQEAEAYITRGGEEVPIKIKKKFRKYVMLAGSKRTDMRYFKEFGDPRHINALDGKEWPEESVNEAQDSEKQEFVPATEVIHFKYGNGTYGIPRWIGTLLAVMGMTKAEYVNYSLFDDQGIPPLIINVAGGQLTQESYDDLLRLFYKAKSYQNFNKLLVLEAESTTQSLDGKEAVPKLDVQNLMEYRKEDAMFVNYLNDGREHVRKHGFRISGLYTGEVKDHNYASAKIARETAEEQVFVPERRSFDEVVNTKIVREAGAKTYLYRSKAPVIQSPDDLLAIIPQIAEKGGMTINELVTLVNQNFGLNLQQYDEEWANIPIPMALKQMGADDDGFEGNVAKSAKVLMALTAIEDAFMKHARKHNDEHETLALEAGPDKDSD
jgi:PBSX family phage portal protein